ncbi:MAG: creatininase family protein [Mycobacterium sp.]
MTVISFGHLTSPQIREVAAGLVVVQPIGATEQHGPHLPVLTDTIVAESVAIAAAEHSTAECAVLPTLAYGRSGEHRGFPGTISLSTSTLLAVCMELGSSLAASGVSKLVFVNGHGGQPHALEVVARDIRAACGLQVFVTTPMRAGVPAGWDVTDAEYGIHAGQVETSVMLALAPDLVHMNVAAADGHGAHAAFAACDHLTLEGATPTAWLTEDFSATGVFGDPGAATVELGRAVLEHWTTVTAATLTEIATFRMPGGSR